MLTQSLALISSILCVVLACVASALAQNQTILPEDDTQVWPEVQATMALNNRVDLVINGQLRIGRNVSDFVDERGGMGLVIKVHKYFSLSPSYLHIATQPTPHRKAFENRLSLAATLQFPLGCFTLTDRNLFERRLREPANSTRYRNRLQIAHPLGLGGLELTAYLADEVSYDWSVKGWTRNRLAAGATRRLNRNLTWISTTCDRWMASPGPETLM
ncbi:MAG TPA: DUF2490 domain-containing protein [Pyrinomonadaceae bacterium]|nr:DUF2490 domain-containing protein [Pyrinomonadaceae bacterium]